MTRTHWTTSLEDSVSALGAAARELQAARQHAQLAVRGVDLDRLRLHDGRVSTAYGRQSHEPHLAALSRLVSLYGQVEGETGRMYEEAALLYASGALWAVRAVLAGQTPRAVEFAQGPDGALLRHPLTLPELDPRYGRGHRLTAAHEDLVTRNVALTVAEDLAARDDRTDHEDYELGVVLDSARGLADAAHRCGVEAECALRFVLIGPRRAYETALVTERTQQYAADGTTTR
ncbi:hypothetical protein [Streptomyces sp. NPDC095602]|uniref:hypothetical protein n=1 Tax=Streptomyces sp. NPDC095602 TaxID=3155819 RepID=UPI003321D39E